MNTNKYLEKLATFQYVAHETDDMIDGSDHKNELHNYIVQAAESLDEATYKRDLHQWKAEMAAQALLGTAHTLSHGLREDSEHSDTAVIGGAHASSLALSAAGMPQREDYDHLKDVLEHMEALRKKNGEEAIPAGHLSAYLGYGISAALATAGLVGSYTVKSPMPAILGVGASLLGAGMTAAYRHSKTPESQESWYNHSLKINTKDKNELLRKARILKESKK